MNCNFFDIRRFDRLASSSNDLMEKQPIFCTLFKRINGTLWMLVPDISRIVVTYRVRTRVFYDTTTELLLFSIYLHCADAKATNDDEKHRLTSFFLLLTTLLVRRRTSVSQF